MIGKTLAHYEILEKIGAGGMGDVYRARDSKLERDVAIKVLPAEFAHDPDRRKRFEREAKAIAALKHPNIVTIYSVEEADGVHFLTMEYIEGQPLSHVIPTGGMAIEPFFDYAIAMADAIGSAHEEGITHRDLKPPNVMLDRNGRVKVLDFGLAKLLDPAAAAEGARTVVDSSDTAVGQVLGTAAYMSPEQAEGKPVDHRTDIFSLGIVYYEMATGERPFKGDTRISTISSILKDTPPTITEIKGTLPRHLGRIVNHCLEKNPERRYQSAKDVRNELSGLKREIDSGQYASGTNISEVSVPGTPPASPTKARKWPVWAIVSGAVAIAAIYFGTRQMNSNQATVSGTGTAVHSSTSPAATPPTSDRKMTVVFPFDNLGPAEDAYFAAGMSEEITSRLAAVSGLGVISRTSATQYDRTGKTMKDIVDDLGVDYVLEGTVRWASSGERSRVRITPQLIRASDDTHVWSETYDREIDDIFEVQTDIATRVIEQLGVTLLGSERALVEDAPTDNMEAYKLYLQARNLTTAGDPNLYDKKMTELLNKATELDPNFTEAWAELSRHHSSLYNVFDQTEERLSRARSALQKAKALEPDNYRTRLAQGSYYYYGFREYDQALKEYLAAAEAVPNDADSRAAVGYIYRRQGKWAECLEALEAALELNPQDANLAGNIASSYYALREFDKAIQMNKRAHKLDPTTYDYVWGQAQALIAWKGDLEGARQILIDNPAEGSIGYEMGWNMLSYLNRRPDKALEHARRLPEGTGILGVLKQYMVSVALARATSPEEAGEALEEAGEALEKLLETAPSNFLVRQWYAHNLALRGQDTAAVREAKLAVELTAKDKFSGPSNLGGLAVIYALVGREEEAIDLLERLLRTKYNDAITHHNLRLSPVWDPLRENPRFQELLKENT